MGFRPKAAAVTAMSATALTVLVTGAVAAERVGTTCFGQPATIVGTDGDDTLRGTPGNDAVVGGDGTDIIVTGEGDDLVCGEEGGDFMLGQGGNDSLDGGAGNDSFAPGAGDDRIVDAEGLELIAFSQAPGPVTASLATGTATGEGNDTFSGVEGLFGGSFNDTLTGDSSDFNALGGGPGDDVLDGGPGFDGAIFDTGPVTASLQAGTAVGEGNDTLRGIDGIEGTKFDDNFTGDDGTNVLDGRNGSDILRGLGGADLLQGDSQVDQAPGNDRLDGGAGDDFLQPSPGTDILDGGAGTLDLVDFSQLPGGVVASLATGTATGPGAGSPKFVKIEGFSGTPFADSLRGNAGPNILRGGDGADRLFGAAGDDFLSGDGGADPLDGGPGIDYCLDGRGKGCEYTGVPGGSRASSRSDAADLAAIDSAVRILTTGASPVRFPPAAPLAAAAAGDHAALGAASCVGSTSRTARSVDSFAVKRRRTSAGPPHKAPEPKQTKGDSGTSPFLARWLEVPPFLDAATAPIGDLTWQGTLFRYDVKRRAWRQYRRTEVAFGVVDPSGAAVWSTAAGAPLDRVTLNVPAGQFAWKAVLSVPGEAPVNDWIEPHTDYARQGGGVFAPLCTFR